MDKCIFSLCNEENLEIQMVVIDQFGYHWFCSNHWTFASYLFNKNVIPCVRNENGCRKNHAAEYYPEDKTYLTIKFDSKYYELCDTHMAMYDELLGIFVVLD